MSPSPTRQAVISQGKEDIYTLDFEEKAPCIAQLALRLVQLLVSLFCLLKSLKVTQGSDNERKARARKIKPEEAICWQFSSHPFLISSPSLFLFA